MKTIVIVDTLWTGHHPTYLNFVAMALIQSNHQVVVLCAKPNEVYESIYLNTPEKIKNLIVDTLVDAKLPPIKIRGMNSFLPIFSRWYKASVGIKKASKKFNFNPDFVLFNYFDSYLYPSESLLKCRFFYALVKAIFPYKWLGILFHTEFEDVFFSPHKYKILCSKKCQAFAVLSERNATKLRFIDKNIVVLPDIADKSLPNDTYPVVQQIRDKARGRSIIGLLGSLARRKGMLAFIEIAKKSVNQPYLFLLAGSLDKSAFSQDEISEIMEFYESNPDNCFFWFERMPKESDFNALVNQCDLLYAVYDTFSSSSNILTKATLFNKPILVAQGYLMERQVKEFNLGLSASQWDIDEQIECIRILLNKEDFLLKVGQPRFKDFRNLTSTEAFDNKLLSLFDT